MSVSSKMTAIANKVRAILGISGTMGLDAMATNLNEVETEVNTQSSLLSQAITLLDGKVAGGGGSANIMSAFSKSEVITWTPTSDMGVLESEEVSHTLGEIPDGYILIGNVNYTGNYPNVWFSVFDKSFYHNDAQMYLEFSTSIRGTELGETYKASPSLSDFMTSNCVKIGFDNDLHGNVVYKAGTTYKIIVYKW